MRHYESKPIFRVLILCAVFAALLAVAGCGDNSRIAGTTTPTNPVTSPTPPPATPTPTPAPAATTAVQVRLGDAPADQLLNFEVTFVSPLKATLSTGEEVTADLASNNRIELTHMASKFEPLLLASLPQGTYTSATITIANPSLIYVYAPAKKQPSLTKKDFPGTQTVTVNFNPPITFGPDASVFNLDINVANTLSFDSNDDHLIAGVDFTLPGVFNFTQQSIGAATLQQHDNGELESVVGTVAAVSANSLVISTGQSGALLNVFVDSATIFSDPLKGLGDAANQIVEVQGYTAADGTFVANSVQALTSNAGASVEGVVVGPDGNSLITNDVLAFTKPPNAFTFLTQDGTGSGTKLDDVGFTFTVQTGTSTVPATFSVDYGKCDWTGLEENQSEYFAFDQKHLFAGQRVAAVTSSALPANDLSPFIATSISLQQQPVVGTITKYYPPAVGAAVSSPTPSTTYPGTIFLLTLPADSYVAVLSGSTQIWVYQGPATDIEFLSTNAQQSIGVGTVVRVRGMLFDSPKPRSFMTKDGFVPPDNSLTMVARRVTEMVSAPNSAPLVH